MRGTIGCGRSSGLPKNDDSPSGRDWRTHSKDAKSVKSSGRHVTHDAVVCGTARSDGRDFVIQQLLGTLPVTPGRRPWERLVPTSVSLGGLGLGSREDSAGIRAEDSRRRAHGIVERPVGAR